eukprot:gene3968-14050_t
MLCWNSKGEEETLSRVQEPQSSPPSEAVTTTYSTLPNSLHLPNTCRPADSCPESRQRVPKQSGIPTYTGRRISGAGQLQNAQQQPNNGSRGDPVQASSSVSTSSPPMTQAKIISPFTAAVDVKIPFFSENAANASATVSEQGVNSYNNSIPARVSEHGVAGSGSPTVQQMRSFLQSPSCKDLPSPSPTPPLHPSDTPYLQRPYTRSHSGCVTPSTVGSSAHMMRSSYDSASSRSIMGSSNSRESLDQHSAHRKNPLFSRSIRQGDSEVGVRSLGSDLCALPTELATVKSNASFDGGDGSRRASFVQVPFPIPWGVSRGPSLDLRKNVLFEKVEEAPSCSPHISLSFNVGVSGI